MSSPQTVSLDGNDWTVYWLHPGEWQSQRVWEAESPDARERRTPATVPGSVQQAAFNAAGLLTPFEDLEWKRWQWTSERDWVYEKGFAVPAEQDGMRFHLRFEGIDPAGHVFLNGEKVGDHEGQFVAAEWDVTSLVRAGEENRLLVVVERAPDLPGPEGPASDVRVWKARFAYGSEGAPRLVPLGLWDSVTLRATGAAWFRNVTAYTNLSTDRTEAALSIVCEFGATGEVPATVVTEITQSGFPVVNAQDPITIWTSDTSLVQSLTLPRVQLWWPNGHGRQPLYQARMTLFDAEGNRIDARTIEFGVRQVDAVPCDGAPPDSFPYSLVVNGKRIWLKGWNWAPAALLYEELEEDRYEALLRLVRAAHVNILRVPGGGLLEKEAFYRLCDRYGILVWQELPQSGSSRNAKPGENEPPADREYLRYIGEQAEGMLARRRNHPSLVLWAGGSGLSGADGQPLGSDHPALSVLRQSIELEDPQRLWLPASPTGPHLEADPEHAGELHDVHGPWHWLGLREHPGFYNRIDPQLHSAFGCEGLPRAATVQRLFHKPAPLPSRGNSLWRERGGEEWLRPETLQEAFGELRNIEAFVRAAQLLQAMGLQYAIESNRRRKWRCAGTLPWRFNEPWPNLAGPNAVDYDEQPRPAYYAVKRAYSPLHVSASFSSFAWSGEPLFRADVWLHNSGAERSLLNVVATVVDLNGRELYQENLAGEALENAAENVGDLSWRFPPEFTGAFLLCLEVIDEEGETLARNAYLHSRAPDPPFRPFLGAPGTTLEAARTVDGIVVRNTGAAVAVDVALSGEALIEDSGFVLAPGAERALRLDPPAAGVRVSAWNAPEITL